MMCRQLAKVTLLVTALFVLLIDVATADSVMPGWDPALFQNASTIQIMTTEPDIGEHWSNLWVVVIDGQPYVRLGSRAY